MWTKITRPKYERDAGLGGFHQGLARLGHKCVLASEIDPELADIYERNFGFKPAGDIRDVFLEVPAHDILCAGFPCQPFSKAGGQKGLGTPSGAICLITLSPSFNGTSHGS